MRNYFQGNNILSRFCIFQSNISISYLSLIILSLYLSGCGANDNNNENNEVQLGSHKTTLMNAGDYTELQGERNELKVILPLHDRNPPAALTEPCYFQDTSEYPLHIQFLRSVTGLESLSNTQYESMILPINRSLWAGELQLNTATPHPVSGDTGIVLYVLSTDDNSDVLQATAAEISAVDKALKTCMPWASSKLVYTTISSAQDRALNNLSEQLSDAGVAWIRGNQIIGELDSTLYSEGENYGYLKRFEAGETPEDVGRFDIVISERASNDLSLLGGIVTDLPQTYLSHLNIRLREKQIPSAQVPGILDNALLQNLDGKLVHMVTANNSVKIEAAQLDKAQAFWDSHHPTIGQLEFDLSQKDMLSFDTLRHSQIKAYGAKAANLGDLYQALGSDDAVKGFGIPIYWYDQFMKSSGMDTEVETLLDDAQLYEDAEYRRDQLKALRKKIRKQALPEDFLDLLKSQLNTVFGEDVATTRIRFRSSTNAEDLSQFSGAGLYDSKSGCLADLEDNDEEGPSHCLHQAEKTHMETQLTLRRQELLDHPERSWLNDIIEDLEDDLSEEKPLDEAVLKVWASLWTERAFDEREYYDLDHRKAFMGIAVNKSFVMEQLEAVVITADTIPDDTDSRQLYRVISQLGNIGVVKPDDPSAVAEEMTFRRQTIESAQINDVRILTRSSLSPNQDLWGSDQRQILAQLLFKAHDHFSNHVYTALQNPRFDIEVEVLLDAAGNRKTFLKQLRPYLSGE